MYLTTDALASRKEVVLATTLHSVASYKSFGYRRIRLMEAEGWTVAERNGRGIEPYVLIIAWRSATPSLPVERS